MGDYENKKWTAGRGKWHLEYNGVMDLLDADVYDSRGPFSTLFDFLAVAHNMTDGTLKSTVTAANWAEEADTVAYASSSTFTVDGDKTSVYTEHRALRLNDSTTCFVLSSSYSTNTTVTVIGGTVPNPLTKVEYGQPVASSPNFPSGTWDLLEDLNIESNTFFVGHADGSYANKAGINTNAPDHTFDVHGVNAQIDINAISGEASLGFQENGTWRYILRYDPVNNFVGILSTDSGPGNQDGWVWKIHDGKAAIALINGTVPVAAIAGEVQVFSEDSSDATATLGLFLEQAVEPGAPTVTHKIKIKINGIEYWWGLDPV